MPNPAFFSDAFTRFATNDAIGDPNGLDAYGYIRVSSDVQAEESRTGLPRQVKHIHEIASEKGYRIPWTMIFADDESGFTLERPALEALMREVGGDSRRGDVVFIEHLDRLSRDVDWHQGYLLHLFDKKYQMQVFFWKQFSSRVERVVMGAISQDGMERTKGVMKDGMREKAESGRVTCKSKVAYGYMKVDGNGKVSDKTKRDTHYGIMEEEAAVIRFIYESVGYEGKSLKSVTDELNRQYRPPKGGKVWYHKTVQLMISNPVYKGKFAAYRQKILVIERIDPITGLTKKIKKSYWQPEDQWVYVDVPAIVPEELWDATNKVLAKNKAMASRNAKVNYLLSGIIFCAIDGRSYTGNRCQRPGEPEYLYYQCSTRRKKYIYNGLVDFCGSLAIRAELLEAAVWKVVKEVLENPERLLSYLDDEYNADWNQSIFEQISFCHSEIDRMKKEDKKSLDLYHADGYTADEYAAIHKGYKEKIVNITEKVAKLEKNVLTAEKVAQKKAYILEITARARSYKLDENPPFEIKQALIKIAVTRIVIHQKEGWFRLEGEINGTWPLAIGKMMKKAEDVSINGTGDGNNDGIKCSSSTLMPMKKNGRSHASALWTRPIMGILPVQPISSSIPVRISANPPIQ